MIVHTHSKRVESFKIVEKSIAFSYCCTSCYVQSCSGNCFIPPDSNFTHLVVVFGIFCSFSICILAVPRFCFYICTSDYTYPVGTTTVVFSCCYISCCG